MAATTPTPHYTVGQLAQATGTKNVTIRYYERMDIRELLRLADRREASCAAVDAKVAEQLEQVRMRLRDLRALEDELQRLSACCEGGVIEECRIIESLSARGGAETEGRAGRTQE